ncbi:FAD-dependent monooxygenase [Streptomyces sp. RTd22]|uniref:FAD-dependent monooxygenase n=1 Tax=Streptomyces sp. RTd22 TaxID=1841249 RepID=UPI0007C51CDB|nr:FAD-dependent monooxygenase [Streptomyces sp. RTd22]
MNETETDVVIVGAGPTGLTLAYELALAGVETLVLEKLTSRNRQTKGGAIQARTAELLESRGLLEAMRRRAIPGPPVGANFALLPVPLDCGPWDTRHPSPVMLPQWEIEEVLEERATALGAGVRRGVAVTAVEPDDDGVTVTTTDGGPPVRARYVVACDGGRSAVRKALGVPFPGRPGTYLAVLADIRLSAASALVPRERGQISTLTRQANGYWSMLIPLGDDRYRLTYGAYGREDPADLTRDTPVGEDEIAAALRAVYGEETVLGGVDNSSRFSDATRQVERYREGRVLFAGDAAHIHPPLGAQGLNLGVQDAFNLGWKLAATVQGRAPAGLLDTYHAERHPVAARVLHHTSAQRVLADPRPSEDVAALREIFTDLMRLPDTNRYLSGLISGLALHYDVPGAHPLTGRRIPDAELTTPDGPTRLSALFGSGHAVLLDVAGLVPDEIRLPGHVDLVRAKPPAEVDLGAGALLLRPDVYVCWAADDAEACREELPRAIAAHLVDEGETV